MEKYLKLNSVVGLDVYRRYLKELSIASNAETDYKSLPLDTDRSNTNYFWQVIEQLKYKADLCTDLANKFSDKLESIDLVANQLGNTLAGELQESNSSIARFYIAKNRGSQYKAIDLRNLINVPFFDPKQKLYIEAGSKFDSGFTSIVKDNNMITAISYVNKEGEEVLVESNKGKFLVTKILATTETSTNFSFHIELNGYSRPQWIYFESDYKNTRLRSVRLVSLNRIELRQDEAVDYFDYMETESLSNTRYKEAFDGFNRGSFIIIPPVTEDFGIKHLIANFTVTNYSTIDKAKLDSSSIVDKYMSLTEGESSRFEKQVKPAHQFNMNLESIACGRFDNSEDKVFTSEFRLESNIKEIELVQSSRGAIENYIELSFFDNNNQLVWKETAPIEANRKDVSEVWSSLTQPGTSMSYEVNNYNREILFPINQVYKTSFRSGLQTESNQIIVRLANSYNLEEDDGIGSRVLYSIDLRNWDPLSVFNDNSTYREEDVCIFIKIMDPSSEELNSPLVVSYPKFEKAYKTIQQGLEYKANNSGIRITVPVEYSYSSGRVYSLCRYSNSPIYSHYSSYGDEMPLIKSSYLLVK